MGIDNFSFNKPGFLDVLNKQNLHCSKALKIPMESDSSLKILQQIGKRFLAHLSLNDLSQFPMFFCINFQF